MCRRKTAAMQTIEAMCARHEFDKEELAVKAKMLLKSYRQICWTALGSFEVSADESYCLSKTDIAKAIAYLYAYEADTDRRQFEQTMESMFDSKWIIEVVDSAMLQVHEFPDDGNLYFEILQKMFLGRYRYVESELLDILQIERSRFYERKKEAVIIFGLALWGTVLPNIASMMEDDPPLSYAECEIF